MIVMKFGGTSVGSAEAIARTMEIVRGRLELRPVVVVSAMSKVTDMLYAISECVSAGDRAGAVEALGELRRKHIGTVEQILSGDPFWKAEAESRVKAIIDGMASFIDGALSGGGDFNRAVINSRGEYLSSNILYCAMNSVGIKTAWVDAREFMITDDDTLQGVPDMEEIVRLCPKVIDAAFCAVESSSGSRRAVEAVITQGFVGVTRLGEETVLGRGGSDYSASIIGMAVDAGRIEIWTDVDGIRSADPRKVDHTLCIGRISFEEAAEMARAGAKVLHPKTIEPAVGKNIPVMVLNSMNPEGEGTTILQSAYIEDGVKSVSSKDKVMLLSVSVPVMDNVSELLTRTFATLGRCRVAADLVGVTPEAILLTTDCGGHLDEAVKALSEFAEVAVDEGQAQVSVIGKNIPEIKGALRNASELLRSSALVTMARNDSFVNISFVVPRGAVQDATRQIHTYLFG